MDITEAYNLLYKYYSYEKLNTLYKKKGFEGSETDTINKYKYNAELLRNVLPKGNNDENRSISLAAELFDNLYEKEKWNR